MDPEFIIVSMTILCQCLFLLSPYHPARLLFSTTPTTKSTREQQTESETHMTSESPLSPVQSEVPVTSQQEPEMVVHEEEEGEKKVRSGGEELAKEEVGAQEDIIEEAMDTTESTTISKTSPGENGPQVSTTEKPEGEAVRATQDANGSSCLKTEPRASKVHVCLTFCSNLLV